MPVTDIDPTTVMVNGVAFPSATLVADPDIANHLNGILDAIITISPRSALNLANGSRTFTITGKTLATSPLPNFTWTGTATVTVTGGSGGSGPAVRGRRRSRDRPGPRDPVRLTFGANQYTPSLSALSALNYQPIPLSVALNEYLPPPGFRARLYSFNHPGKKVEDQPRPETGRASGINTLSSQVFNRSLFHAQEDLHLHPQDRQDRHRDGRLAAPGEGRDASTTTCFIDDLAASRSMGNES